MGFIKRCIVSFTAIFLIVFGGSGIRSDNTLLQVGAAIGLIIGLIALYIFIKMAWRAMGCLPAILIIFALTFFTMYGIGAFSGGFDNISNNIGEFLGNNAKTAEEVITDYEEEYQNKQQAMDRREENGIVNLIDDDRHKIFTESMADKFLPKTKTVTQTSSFNPMKYPAIFGVVRVLSGDTLVMNNYIIRLYAVAAPDIKQTCAAHDGRGYRCGQQSAMWLSNWLSECHIVKEVSPEQLIGVCMLGAYDIGAAIINAGWAVANPSQSKIYVPYQNQAYENRRGMWDGKFYMPWDWQKIQHRKANIKIIPKKRKTPERGHVFSFF